ncbi:MAG TPA: PAS domain-containing sensor histidine kinase [Cellvibrionaceae bacterium]
MNERTLPSSAGKTTPLERAILDSASFSIIATDENGIIQLFNVGAERMLGYSATEVINQLSPSAMHDLAEVEARAQALSTELNTKIAPGFEALAFKASRGIADIYELTQIRKDGSRFPCLMSITALRDEQGIILGYLLIGTDNSLRAAAEAERNHALALAEKAAQAKSRFLSSMSHELHTPLSSILGFAQLIQTGTPPPSARQKHSLEQIVQAGWYLLELINQLLELAEIESGHLSLNSEAVELAEVMRECQAMMEPQATRRSIATQFPANTLAFRVQGDRTRVKQVLLNLLSNAVKYNREGGAIIVACQLLSATRLRITVADSGPGLSQEQITQLFQPFNRLGREHSAEEGTGIGLVMTKYLVEMMDGEIGVTSNPGNGCVFWVDLTLSQEIPGYLQISQK